MKIYTGCKINNNKSYVGYLIKGEHNQEYALNVFKVNTIDSVKAQVLGVEYALLWVKNNKPLYCDSSNIVHYQKFQDCSNYVEMLDLELLKRCKVKSIVREPLKEEDKNILSRLDKNIEWSIQKDKSCGIMSVKTRD